MCDTIELPDIGFPLVPARVGIHRYFHPEMHSVYLEPDTTLIDCHQHHRASVGILTNRWNFPVGVVAYGWLIRSSDAETASGYALTLLVLLTALLDPLIALRQGRFGHLLHQLWVLVLVVQIVCIVQPLYELGWQLRRPLRL